MRLIRRATDGGGRWELDVETPAAMEGAARQVPGDPLPLGVSRGGRVTRGKQLDFLHRFMASPLVPSFSAAHGGLSLSHAHLAHLTENWSATIMEQLHVPKIIEFVKESMSKGQETSFLRNLSTHLVDIVSFGAATELLLTPDSTFLLEMFNIRKGNRGKFIYYHKLPQQNLTVEAAWPGLFIDNKGTYWDVPLSLSVDLASVGSGSGLSYHLCLQHNSGQPKFRDSIVNSEVPSSLLPGSCVKAALSFKRNVEFWMKKEPKLKLVQPYDIFLSDPHVMGSAIIGAVASASIGDCSSRLASNDVPLKCNAFRMFAQRDNCGLFTDLFGTLTFSAQHGNFQRLFLDLSKVSAKLDFASGTRFLSGATCLAQDFFYSRKPDIDTLHAVCPDVTLSLQQQIVGPFSFRVDSKVLIDPRQQFSQSLVSISDPVFAVDWALQVLGSARATAWYSPKHREAMVELRFFEC